MVVLCLFASLGLLYLLFQLCLVSHFRLSYIFVCWFLVNGKVDTELVVFKCHNRYYIRNLFFNSKMVVVLTIHHLLITIIKKKKMFFPVFLVIFFLGDKKKMIFFEENQKKKIHVLIFFNIHSRQLEKR